MYLWASNDLNELGHAHRSLIYAAAFLTGFTLYVILVWGVFYCIYPCFLVLYQTDMREIKEETCL